MSHTVAVGFVAIGLCVVECLKLVTIVPLCLFSQQLFAVVEQVTWQQEAGQREDQQAEVDLKRQMEIRLKVTQ